MKQFFFLILALPVVGMAQQKARPKKAVAPKAVVQAVPVKPADGFLVAGLLKGYPEGTAVALLNGQTGVPESETVLKKNRFVFTGKVSTPEFKIILINKQPPYITLFLDNSEVKVTGTKDSLESAIVSGSPAHAEYDEFIRSLQPYQQVFGENAPYDSTAVSKVKELAASFVNQHPNSFISPLAIIRYSQLSDETAAIEGLFNTLSPGVKVSPIGNYLAQQITEMKRNAIGTLLPDFTQPDTTGKPVSLSSYRGKYVLIDFWASWCRPCRQENPNVVANYNKFKDKNFTVLGVSLDKAKDAWVNAINMDGLSWGHVSDLQGWQNSVSQQFSITSIPQNFLIDPDGKIIGKNLRGPALEKKLADLLK